MPLYIEENFTHVLRDKLRTGELDAIIIARCRSRKPMC